LRSAIVCMSKLMTCRAATSPASITAPESAMPLPGRSFSCTAKARCVEAITVVRSGVTRPRMIERPASIHSAASTTSTSPGVGISAKIGRLPSRSGSISM